MPISDTTTAKPRNLSAEIGSSGLKKSAGLVFEEFLPALQGHNAIAVYREMAENDPIVGALLFAIDKLMRQIEWKVEAGGDSAEDEDAAQFLEECMNDMSMTWSDVISEVASMFPHGWAYLEVIYKQRNGDNGNPDNVGKAEKLAEEVATSKYDDGRIGWRKMPIRAQETLDHWEFDQGGGIRGMWQRTDIANAVLIPIEKSLLFRTSTHKNNPEGRSILRNAYRPWYFLKRIQEIEAVGIERDLAGLPIMWVDHRMFDADASPEVKSALENWKKVVTNIRRDEQEGLVLPSVFDDSGNPLFKLELLSAGGARTFDTNQVITRYAQYIAMTSMADWLLLGHENVGSFALSSDKTNLFAVSLGAWVQAIASVFNDYAVPRLFKLNGISLENMPKIVPEDIENPDLAVLGTFLQTLTAAGATLFPNDDLLKKLMQVAGMPEPTDEQLDLVRQAAEAAAAQAENPLTPAENNEVKRVVSGP
jgi:hypothetical protein